MSPVFPCIRVHGSKKNLWPSSSDLNVINSLLLWAFQKNCIVKTSETLIIWSASCYTAGSDKSDAIEGVPDRLVKRVVMVFRVHTRHGELLLTYWCSQQGCKQDVKSQDRDETETVNLQDRDETEAFHFFKLSRPRRDRDVRPSRPRRVETFQKRLETASRPRHETETFQKNVSRTQCRSLKIPTGEVSHWQPVSCRSDPLFSSWYIRIACMFTRLKSRDRDVISSRPRRDRDVEPSRPRRDRDVRFFQTLETETRPRHSTFKTTTRPRRSKNVSRPRRSRPRLHPCFEELSLTRLLLTE